MLRISLLLTCVVAAKSDMSSPNSTATPSFGHSQRDNFMSE